MNIRKHKSFTNFRTYNISDLTIHNTYINDITKHKFDKSKYYNRIGINTKHCIHTMHHIVLIKDIDYLKPYRENMTWSDMYIAGEFLINGTHYSMFLVYIKKLDCYSYIQTKYFKVE